VTVESWAVGCKPIYIRNLDYILKYNACIGNMQMNLTYLISKCVECTGSRLNYEPKSLFCSMLIYQRKTRWILVETAQGIEKENPKMDRLQKKIRRKRRNTFLILKLWFLNRVVSLKKNNCENKYNWWKENKSISMFKWIGLVEPY